MSISLLTFANGFLIPFGMAGSISAFTVNLGYVSGLVGFLKLAGASLSFAIIDNISHNSVTKMGMYILIAAILGLMINLLFTPKIEQKNI